MTQQEEIFNAMSDINLLSAKFYDAEVIKLYAKKIIELEPKTRGKHIKLIMDNFFNGKKDFNPNFGIRNFTSNLKSAFDSVRYLELNKID